MCWVFTEVIMQDDTVTFELNRATFSASFVRVNQCNGQDFH